VKLNYRFITLVLITNILLASCKKTDQCSINFYLSGTVLDISGNALSDVEVYSIDEYGGGPTKWTITDSEGKYSFFRGSYSTLGNEYLFFKKAGYKDSKTTSIGKGSGACGDQQIVRAAVMEAQ
jgi:hypothetical protein